MSDPRRWLDPRGDASDDVRALLDAAAAPPPLPPGVREAGARYVATLSKAAAPVAATATVSAKAITLLGSVGVAVALGAVAVRPPKPPRAPAAHSPHVARRAPARATPPPTAAPTALPTAPPPAPPVAPAPAPLPVEAPAPALVLVPAPVADAPTLPRVTARPQAFASAPRRRAHASPPALSPAAPRVASTGLVAAAPAAPPSEESRIEEARARLATSPGLTLALVRSQPGASPYAEEGDYLAFRALAAIGRDAEARGAGEAFVARWPGSIYAPAVRARLAALR